MSLIPKIAIPVVGDASMLKAGFADAMNQVTAFSQKAVAPVAFALDVAPAIRDLSKVREVAEDVATSALTAKVMPVAPKGFGAFSMGAAAIDAGAGKAADVVVQVSQSALKASLDVAKGTVRASVRAMAAVATIPLSVAHVGLRVGFGVAQALVFAKIKQMTGASVVQILVAYAAFKVGLAVAQRLLRAAVGTMARVAAFPIKVTLNALRAGLRAARSLVVGAARQIGAAAAVPLKIAGAATGIGLAGTALGGLVGVPAAIAGSVLAASDLNETVSKVGQTFGKSAGIVTAGADEMAKKFGVPKREFLDSASGIGLIGKAAKLTEAQSATLGVNFAKLGADAASFYNIPLDDALEKIRSGLVGEAEPLRALGVLLSENAVKAQAATMGLKSVKGELTEGQKVLARAALITEGLKTAQGDLARTAGGLANRLREVWGRLQNLAQTIGQFLLPAAESLAATFATIAGDLAKGIESNRGVFERWGGAIKAAADWLGIAYRNASEIKALGGLFLGDVQKYLVAAVKAAFSNILSYGQYFAERLGYEIERAIRIALHAASPKVFSAYVGRPMPEPPKTVGVDFKANPLIAQTVGRVMRNEVALNTGKAVAEAAGRLKEAAAGFVANNPFAAAVRKKVERVAAQPAKASKAFADNTAFMASRGRAEAAADARRTARGRRGLDRVVHPDAGFVETKGPKKREKPVTLGDVLGALGQANANLAGIGAGLGGPAAIAAAQVSTKMIADKVINPSLEPKFAGLAERNSREAYSAVVKHAAGGRNNDDAKRVARNSDAQTKLQGRMVAALEKTGAAAGAEVYSMS